MLWFRLREIMGRLAGSREPRPPLRGGSKPAAAPPARTYWWLLGLGLLVLVLHLVLFPPVPRFNVDFPEAGDIAGQEIRAPFPFEAPLPDQEVQMQRLEKVVEVPPVLQELTRAAAVGQEARFDLWLTALAVAVGDTAPPASRVELLTLQFPSVNSSELLRLLASGQGDSLVVKIRTAGRNVLLGGLVDMLPAGKYDHLSILRNRVEERVPLDKVVTQAALEEKLVWELRRAGLPPIEAVDAASVMRQFLAPNLVYDPDRTRQRQDEVRQSVPTTREFFRGERIVDQGVRVTDRQALFLAELATQIRARGGGGNTLKIVTGYLVRGLVAAIALGLFGWLGAIHFPGQMRRLRSIITLAVVLVLFLAGSALALGRPFLGPIAVPIVLLSLLATVLFRDKVGYTMTLLALTLLALLPDISGGMVFTWFVLGMVTVVSVRRIQKRSQFYQTFVLLTALSVLLTLVSRSGDAGAGGPGLGLLLVAVFSPVLSVMIGLFLLPVVEPLVGVCSDLTLLELSDLNHPLLQRMALEAQGTYHHSQVVGQLAEHAARAVDANALLTRVGALFHDIGKMLKSEYYVENQRPDLNKHDELSPSMSALVISSHVKEGIELGRKWRLPQQVLDFIPEHHGTMIMEFFYHKALEAEGNETVKVDDFRYPGPKPRSRETAILMLADATEAAARSLAKPTPSRIKELTKQIIDKRMLSGELDESGLTLSDLARIRDAFVPLLTGIHHARIVYPGQKERESGGLERRGDRKVRP